MYRFLAFFWLVMGINLLVLPQAYPQLLEAFPLLERNTPLAGFCFALSVYNMIRWRLIRARELEREREREEAIQRRHMGRPTDPTFDFSDTQPGDEKKPDG